MTTEEVTNYALSLPDVQQKETDNGKWTVFTKGDRVFLLIRRNDPIWHYISVLLPEAKGLELQDEYNIVSPSSINVRNWIDVDIDNKFPIDIILSWIKESYDIVSKAVEIAESDKYVSLSKITFLTLSHNNLIQAK